MLTICASIHTPTDRYQQNVTLTLLEVRDSRCPTGTLCPLLGKATAVIQIGPGKYVHCVVRLIDRMASCLGHPLIHALLVGLFDGVHAS